MTPAGRYPRTCRNGHELLEPADEVLRAEGARGPECRTCARAGWRRKQARRVASGRHAEAVARSERRQAEARDAELEQRITRSGVETKTKNDDH